MAIAITLFVVPILMLWKARSENVKAAGLALIMIVSAPAAIFILNNIGELVGFLTDYR